MSIGAELCNSRFRYRHVFSRRIEFHDRPELDLLEIALLLCLTEREGKDPFAADWLVVVAERRSSELDDSRFLEGILESFPCRSSDMMRLIDKKTGAEFRHAVHHLRRALACQRHRSHNDVAFAKQRVYLLSIESAGG